MDCNQQDEFPSDSQPQTANYFLFFERGRYFPQFLQSFLHIIHSHLFLQDFPQFLNGNLHQLHQFHQLKYNFTDFEGQNP